MANAIVQCQAPTGLTLTLSLYAFSSDDTLANSGGADTLTEKTNNKGLYQATVTEGLSGWHWAKILDGSGNLIAHYAVWMSDTTNTHRCVDLADVYAVGGTAQTSRDIGGTLGAAGAGLTAIPWNAAWDAEVQSEVSDELTARGITSAFFSGITSLAQWLGLIAGKQTGNSTARTELRATGAGSGTYDETTDSLEAVRDNVGAAGAGLTDLGGMSTTMKSQVNAEVVDALATDTYAEPGQGAPAATASIAAKINYLYKSWRNRKTQTSSTWSLYADDATTVDQKATVADDGTTASKSEVATGP